MAILLTFLQWFAPFADGLALLRFLVPESSDLFAEEAKPLSGEATLGKRIAEMDLNERNFLKNHLECRCIRCARNRPVL